MLDCDLVAVDEIFQEIKNSEERIQADVDDLENRFRQRRGSTTRLKNITPPPEVRVIVDVLRHIENFKSFYSITT